MSFNLTDSTSRPLVPKKQVKTISTPTIKNLPLKRVNESESGNIDLSFSNSISDSLQTIKKRRVENDNMSLQLTPGPSSDEYSITETYNFKIPAIPTRHLTPSTSTVAYSSSPPRLSSPLPSSSPIRGLSSVSSSSLKTKKSVSNSNIGKVDQKIVFATLSPGETLLFGRHRHTGSTISVSTTPPNIPSNLSHLLHNSSPYSSKTVHLPRTAAHASRVHAAIEYINQDDSVRVVVLGQNGLRVKSHGIKKRFLQGQRIDLKREKGSELVLDFYGCIAKVTLPKSQTQPTSNHATPTPTPTSKSESNIATSSTDVVTPDKALEKMVLDPKTLFTPPPSSIHSSPPALARSSLPPSSPPVDPELNLDDHLMEVDTTHQAVVSERSEEDSRRSSSPLSTVSDDDISIKKELVENASASAPNFSKLEIVDTEIKIQPSTSGSPIEVPSKTISRQNSPTPVSAEKEIPPLPETIDLPAILASTVVFSGSSKLSLPDLVKHMLESQPSLKDLGDEATWNVWVEKEVEGNEMFGKVSRSGKDSSGRPLLPHYFYNPAADPDKSRAKELGGLVRPLRTVQREGGKAIDWRPVGSGRRKYY